MKEGYKEVKNKRGIYKKKGEIKDKVRQKKKMKKIKLKLKIELLK